ncbi:MAG: hypothetical protein FWF15_05310 [Oscillospiraceae bacterium]|nr:hypothetical protein [Oscillospiraceae bacterium]
MKTLVIYYSYSGATKKIAVETAEKEGAEIYEVMDIKKPGKFKAYVIGSFKAMRGKKFKIEPVNVDFSLYGKIIILSPVWANHPTPQINNILDMLPAGKKIEIYAVSASGKSKKDRIAEVIATRGCELIGYTDIKTGK